MPSSSHWGKSNLINQSLGKSTPQWKRSFVDVRLEDPQISGNATGKPGIDHSLLQDTQFPYSLALTRRVSPLPLLSRDHRPLDKALRGIISRSSDQPWRVWYTDGSNFVLGGKRRAGYAVVSNQETIEAKPLPPETLTQLAEVIALTWALELGKGKRVAIHTDSNYACMLPFGKREATWPPKGPQSSMVAKSSGFWEQPICLSRFQSHCRGHQKGSTEVAQGNQAANQAAKRAVLQSNDLIGVTTLVSQSTLPETPSYIEYETLKTKASA